MDNWKWCFKKNLFFYKNVMLQIDPLKSSCSQKQKYPERPLKLKVLQKSSSLEKVTVPKVTPRSENVYNCCSKKFTMLNPQTSQRVLKFLKKLR